MSLSLQYIHVHVTLLAQQKSKQQKFNVEDWHVQGRVPNKGTRCLTPTTPSLDLTLTNFHTVHMWGCIAFEIHAPAGILDLVLVQNIC